MKFKKGGKFDRLGKFEFRVLPQVDGIQLVSDCLAAMATETEAKGGRLYEEAQLYRDELAQRGVIYMSRIPPFMKPNKARNLLERYGEVTRMYLAEEC